MITLDDQKLEPGAIIQLIELDGEARGMGILRYHAHQQSTPIIWKGETYLPRPYETGGFGRSVEGNNSTPMLKISNIDGTITALCRRFQGMSGVKLTVRQTYVKYLDPANFPDGNPTASTM